MYKIENVPEPHVHVYLNPMKHVLDMFVIFILVKEKGVLNQHFLIASCSALPWILLKSERWGKRRSVEGGKEASETRNIVNSYWVSTSSVENKDVVFITMRGVEKGSNNIPDTCLTHLLIPLYLAKRKQNKESDDKRFQNWGNKGINRERNWTELSIHGYLSFVFVTIRGTPPSPSSIGAFC